MKMTNENKLVTIKIIHTLIWIFYNVVIFYILYAAIFNLTDARLWIAFGLVGFELLLLLIFRFYCPLTLMARKYSDSQKDNFDIYLPNWLAKYNKLIYSGIVLFSIFLLIYHYYYD